MEVHVGASPRVEQGEASVNGQGGASEERLVALWKSEGANLTKYAMLRTNGDQAAAEDLVQAAFTAAVQQWSALAALEDHLQRTWLRRVCRNKWVDSVRAGVREGRAFIDLGFLDSQLSEDPVDTVLARDDLDRCWQVIQGFPPRRRQIALLYFMDMKSELWIAEVLGLQPSGVRKHVAKARQELRAVIAGLHVDEPAGAVTLNAGEEE
ncbi:RNA polymerase sigma factor [Streptomyces sp. NPDC090306]|uniref:RNA polymerase sigma factor n=1 Tax=Streptomyces sp. NPDC090306 TaxID=3365961 RepID=UPI00380EA7C7